MISAARTIDNLELAGNALCLDFANTVNSRAVTVHDYLRTYADLLGWCEHAGALSASTTRLLRPRAQTGAASAALARAHRLRDAIYAVFSAVAASHRPAADDVEEIRAAYAGALENTVIRHSPQGTFELTWPASARATPHTPLWPVGRSAGELLLAGPLDRIGECPGCGWLFLDTSRNGARRWCNMATCGSRDKMARYHRHQRDSA